MSLDQQSGVGSAQSRDVFSTNIVTDLNSNPICICCDSINESPPLSPVVKQLPPANRLFIRGRQYVLDELLPSINRTYEKPYKWYYIVFNPLDRAYNKDLSYFEKNGLRDVMKKLKSLKCYDVNIVTEERKNCQKIHFNALTVTKTNLMKQHLKKYKNKFNMYVQEVKYLDRERVLTYITKEADMRPYDEGFEYLHYRNDKPKTILNNTVPCDGRDPKIPEGTLIL